MTPEDTDVLPNFPEFQTLFQYAQYGSLKAIHEHTLSLWVRLCMPVKTMNLAAQEKSSMNESACSPAHVNNGFSGHL